MYYVYELVNLMGTVEHVGETVRPKRRLYDHTKNKSYKGKFLGRLDISMHVVTSLPTKVEALDKEYELQVYWGLPTDKERNKGSKHGCAKLDEKKVRQIKFLISQKKTYKEIAKMFNVGHVTISLIDKQKRWAHVE